MGVTYRSEIVEDTNDMQWSLISITGILSISMVSTLSGCASGELSESISDSDKQFLLTYPNLADPDIASAAIRQVKCNYLFVAILLERECEYATHGTQVTCNTIPECYKGNGSALIFIYSTPVG